MKKYKVSKEFILEAHKASCSEWKQKLEKEFPKVFEIKIEVGKWYKTRGESLFYLSSFDCGKNKGYGFDSFGDWVDNRETIRFFGYKSDINREATEKEVEEALIKEAKRKGFQVGVRFKGMYKVENLRNGIFFYKCATYRLCLIDNSKDSGNYIFWEGNWAEIIDDKSEIKEQVAKLQKELDTLKSQL